MGENGINRILVGVIVALAIIVAGLALHNELLRASNGRLQIEVAKAKMAPKQTLDEAPKIVPPTSPEPVAKPGPSKVVLIASAFAGDDIDRFKTEQSSKIKVCMSGTSLFQLCVKPVKGGKYAALVTSEKGMSSEDASFLATCLKPVVKKPIVLSSELYKYQGCL